MDDDDIYVPQTGTIKHKETVMSYFSITINTNKRVTNITDFTQYKEGYDRLFWETIGCQNKNSVHLPPVKNIIKSTNMKILFDIEDISIIKKIKCNYGVEVGTDKLRGGRVHAHALIKVKHRDMLRVSIDGLKELANKYLDIPNAYVHVKGWGDRAGNMLKYMQKDQNGVWFFPIPKT